MIQIIQIIKRIKLKKIIIINMKENLKMGKEKEEEIFILIMVDMNEIGKMI